MELFSQISYFRSVGKTSALWTRHYNSLRRVRSGFKPDRHIQRLFDRWYPQGTAQVKPEIERLQRLIGRKIKDLGSYLTYSLVGISL